jgi:hypothetical protein
MMIKLSTVDVRNEAPGCRESRQNKGKTTVRLLSHRQLENTRKVTHMTTFAILTITLLVELALYMVNDMRNQK